MVERADEIDEIDETAQTALTVPYGRSALEALERAVAGAKHDDPLAPVTVVVPSALAAVTLRRALVRDGGLVAVDTVVLPGLAARLAGLRVAADGRGPLEPLRAAALARATLTDASSRFGSVAQHPATVDAVVRTFTELRTLDPPDLERLAASGRRAREVVELFRSYRRRAEHWLDDRDVVEMAIEAVTSRDPAVDEVGHVMLHLPRRLEAIDASLLAALHRIGRLSVIVGTTGDERADEPSRRVVAQLASAGVVVASATSASTALLGSVPRPEHIVRAADPAEEVRAATRLVLEHLDGGVPADRIAVVSRVRSPYAALVHEDLAAAGVPHTAPAPLQLGQSIAGRALVGMLEWPSNGYRRDDLMRLLRGVPFRDPAGGRARPDRWDRRAREAGVVGGAEQWHQRLDAARRRLVERLADASGARELDLALADGDVPAGNSSRSDVPHIVELDALRAFVDQLMADTDPGERQSWSALTRWAKKLLHTYLGNVRATGSWPESEQRSRDAVEEVLGDLAVLDDDDRSPGFDVFQRVLRHELARPAGRVGRFGHGVFVGRLSEAAGADLDLVVVLGCAEGVFPPRTADDPLLPNRDRRVVRDALPRRGLSAAEEARDVRAAIASARSSTVTFPVADPRGQRTQQPAPLVLEWCSERLGERVGTDRIDQLRDDPRSLEWFTDLPSFEWWLAQGGTPATPTELDLRELLAGRAAQRDPGRLPVAEISGLTRGFAAARARVDGELGEWSGWVGAWPELADDLGHPRSATSLQQWATCPFRYFLSHVLEVGDLEDPGEAETITPADKGTLVHAILERYFRSRIEGDSVDLDDVERELEEWFRAQGRTGRALLWEAEWLGMRRHLRRVLREADTYDELTGLEPAAVEHRFGFSDAAGEVVDPVVVDLGDDRVMRFRGAVDRIDRSPDGHRLVVLDYKTGSAHSYSVLNREDDDYDIVARGTLLQLPVYALAARDAFPDAVDVAAYYWFIGQRGTIEMLGGPIDDAAGQRFRDVLRTMADGIGGGLFPARPGDERWRPGSGQTHDNCAYCPYDALCPAGREEQWVTLRGHEALRDYVALAEPSDDEQADDTGERVGDGGVT